MKKLPHRPPHLLLSKKLISLNKITRTGHRTLTPFVILLLFVFACSSCISKKKLLQISTLAKENKALKGKLDAEITKNKEAANYKAASKEIDSASQSQLIHFLDSSSKQANQDMEEPVPANAQEKILFTSSIKKKLEQNLENVSVLTALLQTTTFIRFNTGAIFKPGGYLIEDDLWKPAYKAFSPILDSIIHFTSQYPSKKFDVTIAILGYSDATPIGRSGTLFSLLTQKLNNPNADKSALNQQLSKMRAESVATVFDDLAAIKICKSNLYDKINLMIYAYGKGEELPDPSMKNVTEDDERRRSVVAYWNVLPKKE